MATGVHRARALVLAASIAACSSSSKGPDAPAAVCTSEKANVYGDRNVFLFLDAKRWAAERSVVEYQTAHDGSLTLPNLAFASSAPSVAEFGLAMLPDGQRLEMRAHTAGTTRLQIQNADTGEILDSMSFTVASVGQIESDHPDGIMIMQGGSTQVSFVLSTAADGCTLRGGGGVDYALGGDLSTVMLTPAVHDTEVVTIDTTVTASGTLSLATPSGKKLSLALDVVDASAVASIHIERTSTVVGGGSTSLGVVAKAQSASGHAIDSPKCMWRIPPASGATLAVNGRDAAVVSSSMHGTVTVFCDVGAVTGSLDLSF